MILCMRERDPVIPVWDFEPRVEVRHGRLPRSGGNSTMRTIIIFPTSPTTPGYFQRFTRSKWTPKVFSEDFLFYLYTYFSSHHGSIVYRVIPEVRFNTGNGCFEQGGLACSIYYIYILFFSA